MGKIVRWHFAHLPGGVCTGEGSRHAIAKHLLASFLSRPIALHLYCPCELPTKPYRLEAAEVKVENSVGDYRCDVTCKVHNMPLFIEVIDTHNIDSAKSRALEGRLVKIDIHDLSDEDVFSGDKARQRFRLELGLLLPSLFSYPYAFIHTWHHQCWRCGIEIPVALLCDNGGESTRWSQSPDWPGTLRKYAHIGWRRTSYVRQGYYANVCPHCKVVQGDEYLLEELIDRCCSSVSRNEIRTVLVAKRKG